MPITQRTVIERGLVLEWGATCAHGGVRPVDLVRLANHHVHAVLPVILSNRMKAKQKCEHDGLTGHASVGPPSHNPKTHLHLNVHICKRFVTLTSVV